MNVIVDTNVFLCVVLEEPEKQRVMQATRGASTMAPNVLPYEIGNALSAMVKRRALSRDEAITVHTAVQAIAVRLVAVDVGQALELALAYGIYAFDAYFLACARRHSCPLLTLDQRMQRVARDAGIELLE